jgi:serine/threonine protein kinase
MRIVWKSSRIRVVPTARVNLRSFSRRAFGESASRIVCLSSWTGQGFNFGQQGLPIRSSHSGSMVNSDSQPHDDVYIPEVDLEDFEEYRIGGYHPTVIGDSFRDGRYEVVHKLGYGGYSTIWLARDKQMQRYVSLKILVSSESSRSTEKDVLRLLRGDDSLHQGQQFIPRLLDDFLFDGPNGRHICLVQGPAGCSIAGAKGHSINFMFPIETARSIAAQLVMGLSYLHLRQVCHGGKHNHPGYR